MCFENQNKSIQLSFEPPNVEYLFTLEAASCNSLDIFVEPQAQCSPSNLSDPRYSFGFPFSVSSVVYDTEVGLILRILDRKYLDPELDIEDLSSYSTNSNPDMDMASKSDLKAILLASAEAISKEDFKTATRLINVLEDLVSVSGEPIERLGAYMLEGLRAKMISSGSILYKKLKCKEPTVPELMSYMHVLSQICPYYSLQVRLQLRQFSTFRKMENEDKIRIINFQIAQGSQWITFIERIVKRPGGPHTFALLASMTQTQLTLEVEGLI